MRAPETGIVYVVDDDPLVLELLRDLVATIGVRSQEFSSAADFLAAFSPRPYACLVCDLRMPGIDGLTLQRELGGIRHAPPLIFLTGFAEVSVAVEAMRRGAFDFVEKPFSPQALLAKIQAALELSRRLHAERLAQETAEARLALLTPKERCVLGHVVEGKSSREISALLGISVRTVEHHRDHIMQKLHVGSTVELVRLCL
ncbi:MAG TPA: response regulator [Rhodocyclaceae bacterium]